MKKMFNTYLFLLQDNIQNLRSYYLGVGSRNAITLFKKNNFLWKFVYLQRYHISYKETRAF